jgi:hypothetical protein
MAIRNRVHLGPQLDPSLFVSAQASINEPSTEKCPRFWISPWQRRRPLYGANGAFQ